MVTERTTIARRMIALAMLAQAVPPGIAIGSYGLLLPSIESQFAVDRTLSSLGLGLVSLAICLTAPAVGAALRKASIRSMIFSGSLLTALGLALLAVAPSIYVFLGIITLAVGTGIGMMSIVAPATLVIRWSGSNRGFALSLINLPIGVMLVPPVAALVVNHFGLKAWLLTAATLFLLISPIFLLVVDHPPETNDVGPSTIERRSSEKAPIRMAALVLIPQFWLLTIGIGIASGTANAFLAHAIPIAVLKETPMQTAALTITLFGAMGLVGTPLIGHLADRIGSTAALSLCTMSQAVLWIAMLFSQNIFTMLGVAAMFGICGGASTSTLHAAAANELFGPRNVSSVLGSSYLFKIPFIFGGPVLAGRLFDVSSSYNLAFTIFAALLIVSALGFVALGVLRSVHREPLG